MGQNSSSRITGQHRCADAGSLPALALMIARLEHSQDEGRDPDHDPHDDTDTLDALIAKAREITQGWRSTQTSFEQMVEGDDGWSEWRHPLPGYLMKCCDCGLVHEMDFAVVRQGRALEGGYYESEDIEDPSIFAMFRARRVDGGEAVHSQAERDRSRDDQKSPSRPATKDGESA